MLEENKNLKNKINVLEKELFQSKKELFQKETDLENCHSLIKHNKQLTQNAKIYVDNKNYIH